VGDVLCISVLVRSELFGPNPTEIDHCSPLPFTIIVHKLYDKMLVLNDFFLTMYMSLCFHWFFIVASKFMEDQSC
jgi:hypothetical protein